MAKTGAVEIGLRQRDVGSLQGSSQNHTFEFCSVNETVASAAG